MCRRPGGSGPPNRGVLSMQGLSYGVVRVDSETSLTSLTLQDCGTALPACACLLLTCLYLCLCLSFWLPRVWR